MSYGYNENCIHFKVCRYEACRDTCPHFEPETPKGEWITKEVRGDKVPYCSVCNSGTGTFYEFDFCPNCGADMRKKEGDNK